MDILGISAYYHDSAAALVRDGELIAAAQEERFSRTKHDPNFPRQAIQWCLSEGTVGHEDLAAVVFYEKPITKFVRVLKSFAESGPHGARSFPQVMRDWATKKLWVLNDIEQCLAGLGVDMPEEVLFAEHHMSHAAAAFYPSPFDAACVLTLDGVGEWATSSIGIGTTARLELIEEMRFPHSLGLLYSAFTAAAGFRVNSGEYKLMGLAPYGRPVFKDRIIEEMLDLRADGSFTMDQQYFGHVTGRRAYTASFEELFGRPARRPEEPITQHDCDLARSAQEVIEEVVLRIGRHGHRVTGMANLAMAGGVALNCVSNARLVERGPFERVWVQPAAGDAGSAAGCALWGWHAVFGGTRREDPDDGMHSALLGPSFDPDEVARTFSEQGRPFARIPDLDELSEHLAALLAAGEVVAVFRGRAEFGPRALGNRSILADPRPTTIQSTLNLRVKQRESFRPFAPAVLAERCNDWFEMNHESPYMVLVAQVRDVTLPTVSDGRSSGVDVVDFAGRLSAVRSPLPGITHVDGSARVQTVRSDQNPAFHRLLAAFERRTGCPVLINTSFNVRGEPIVGQPHDAYRCFMTTDIDWLLVEDCLFDKREQPAWTGPIPSYAPD